MVTGASSGIGYEAAQALAARGARVILAVRDAEKGRLAAERIRRASPSASTEVLALDLADLASVRGFAEAFLRRGEPLPLLINNAGASVIADGTTTEITKTTEI